MATQDTTSHAGDPTRRPSRLAMAVLASLIAGVLLGAGGLHMVQARSEERTAAEYRRLSEMLYPLADELCGDDYTVIPAYGDRLQLFEGTVWADCATHIDVADPATVRAVENEGWALDGDPLVLDLGDGTFGFLHAANGADRLVLETNGRTGAALSVGRHGPIRDLDFLKDATKLPAGEARRDGAPDIYRVDE